MKRQEHIENRCQCAAVENSTKRDDQKKTEKHCCMNVAHCAGPCVFDGDGCDCIEGGYDSLHPLDQWPGFGEQPFPDTETTAYTQPSAQPFFTAFES